MINKNMTYCMASMNPVLEPTVYSDALLLIGLEELSGDFDQKVFIGFLVYSYFVFCFQRAGLFWGIKIMELTTERLFNISQEQVGTLVMTDMAERMLVSMDSEVGFMKLS